MNLKQNIKRILRETLSSRIRRRIPYDEMENEFLESFDFAYDLTKKRKVLSNHFLNELINTTITAMMDGFHWRFFSTLPEDVFWYDEIYNEFENHYRDRIIKMYNEKQGIKESLESRWNEGNYNYQQGFCHYFAYNIIDKIKKLFPNKKVNYYLLLASEVDKETQEPVQEYLIHVYIQIDNILLDSNGITTPQEAWNRAQEWEQKQSHLVPDEYETEVWEEESNEIPEYFFNNKFCNTRRVKQDLEKFLSHPIVKRILRDK
jgi:hypothetical protein